MWKRTVVTTGVVLVGLVLAGAGCRQSSPAAATTAASAIPWRQSLPEALQAAQAEGKPLLVDFWASWCKNCVAMEKTTLKNPEVARRMAFFEVLKFQAEKPDNPKVRKILDALNVRGVPTYIILTPSAPGGGE